MKIEAIFESWHVPDGNYPPLTVGDYVNLSFEVQQETVEAAVPGTSHYFKTMGNAEYEFSGIVLQKYTENDSPPILIIKAGDFKFYINSYTMLNYKEGDQLKGKGTLLLDHYIWVEFLGSYKDAPDLFCYLQVKRIRKVQIPESFVQKHSHGKSLPTRVVVNEIGTEYIEELQSMQGQAFDEEFYLVEFDNEGLENVKIPKTFLQYRD